MQVTIGGVDVTSAVQETTYNVDRITKYTPWVDANNVEHHSNIHHKVEGSFDMVFLPGYSMEYSVFKALVDANTVNDKTTLTLSVNNLDGAMATINCFLTITFKPMRDTKNGSNIIYKRCTCEVKEC